MTELNVDPYWMPFTSNQEFKANPRIIESAKGFHYYKENGDKILDSISGLWTTGAGHCHPKIIEAVQKQVAKLDYALAFQIGHTGAFKLAKRLTDLAPKDIDYCFFVNSGSEAVETALKIALAYHQVSGNTSRTHLIGRQRAYHGTNFGGLSVGGLAANRARFEQSLLPNTHHLSETHSLQDMAFTRGQPQWGTHLADELEDIVTTQGASNIAAVIVEPVAGAGGVLVPPAGYLKRLREICDKHGILLIFDEVITAFGRLGETFSCQRFDVIPDIITTAKGITNGVIPMGAVLVNQDIYNAFMDNTESGIEFFHGYTYSGHPVAAAAGLAALDVYEDEGLFEQSRRNEQIFEDLLHSLKGTKNIIDIRNMGLMGAIELEPRDSQPGARGKEVLNKCFNAGLMIRGTMDTLAFCPFLGLTQEYFDQTYEILNTVLNSVD